MDDQGLVGMIRDADGTRHWYKSYNGVNIWGYKAEGVMDMGPYLCWPNGEKADFIEWDEVSIPYFYNEFYTDKPDYTYWDSKYMIYVDPR